MKTSKKCKLKILLVSIFFTTLNVSADSILTVTVLGDNGNVTTLTGEAAQRYADAMRNQNNNGGNNSQSSGTTVSAPPPPTAAEIKSARCTRDMKNLEADFSKCQQNVAENAVHDSDECNTNSDDRGKEGCRYSLQLRIIAGNKGCDTAKQQTIADCK